MVEPAALLERIAGTLRHEIGPAVSDDFARTQAFMASVILAKLAAQLETADADAVADEREHVEVANALRDAVPEPTSALAEAIGALAGDSATGRWNDVVTQLYAARPQLGPAAFDAALGIVRRTLRARLDRALRAAR